MQRIALKCSRFYRTIPRSINSSVNNYNKSVPFLQYSSTISSIDSKTLSNNRDDKAIERTVLRRNVMQSTESKDCNQIESIKSFADQHIIQINFSEGQTLNFNTFWLRDSCSCPQCVHPLTKSKLFDSADISADLFVDRVDSSGDVLEVQWRVGTEEHISQYSVSWLRLFDDMFEANPKRVKDSSLSIKAPNDGLYDSKVPKPERVLWDSTQIDKQKMTINYKDFMNSNQSLRHYLEVFSRFGVVFLEDVPKEKNKILSVARRMAYHRETRYGSTFDVVFKQSDSTHIAYTGAALKSHIDLPYREKPPGVQMLHCIESASVGGGSTLVDGIKCAEVLRHSNPEAFRVLTENPILFSFGSFQNGIWFRKKRPIIALKKDQTVNEIYYNPISLRAPLLPSNLLDRFYESYRLELKIN